MIKTKIKGYFREWKNGMYYLWLISTIIFSAILGPIVIGAFSLIFVYGISGSALDGDYNYLIVFIFLLSPILLNRFSPQVAEDILNRRDKAYEIE